MKWKMMSEEGKLELIIDTKTLDNELLIHCPVSVSYTHLTLPTKRIV